MKIFLVGKRVYFVPADKRKLRKLWIAIGPYTQEYNDPIFPIPNQCLSMSLIEGDYVLRLVGNEGEAQK